MVRTRRPKETTVKSIPPTSDASCGPGRVADTGWLAVLGRIGLGLAAAGATLFGTLALCYSNLPGVPLRIALAVGFGLGTLLGLIRRGRTPAVAMA